MTKTGAPAIILLLLFLLIMGFAGHGFVSFQRDLNVMREAGHEDITWSATRLELELSRFKDKLIQLQLPNNDVTIDEVNERFDILWSRIALFQQGRVGERLAEYERTTLVVSRLFEMMKQVDRQVVELELGDKDSAKELFDKFDPFTKELAQLSLAVTFGEEKRGSRIRESLQNGLNTTSILTAIAVVLALIILTYVYYNGRWFKKLAKDNQILADKSERASRAKSQFLTMMSHELRTPMNGVMGLLALAKQNESQPKQVRLLEQAEVSSKQMVGLLADILDFSAIQSSNIKLTNKTFEVQLLAKAIEEKFIIKARKEGLNFHISVSENCPKRVQGDFRRMRQAFGHLAQYIAQTAGVRKVEAELNYSDGSLVMHLVFDYISEGGTWMPDLILGAEMRDGDKFATDALGPAIARGLIDTMSGDIKVDAPDNSKIRVLASIPVEVSTITHLCVEVLSENDALKSICSAALKDDRIFFLSEADETEVNIVLTEVGKSTEDEYIQHARNMHPNAILVALGEANTPDAFDYEIALPLDFIALRKFVLKQVA